jgi:hypothetical protein
VLAHGAWVDGSSWSEVISGLRSEAVEAVAVPLPLTTLADDVAALDQMLERSRVRSWWSQTPTPASARKQRPGA